jgi:ribose-phosphate pyrophosphokinase
MIGAIKLISGNANPELAERIASHQGLPVADATVSRFSDGEIQVEISDNVRGRDVFLIQPTCSPANENIMELLILADACKRASAERITAVIPYYGYARQDRKVAPRAPITAKLVADLITAAGINRVMTIDLHAGQIQGFFDLPVDNLYASKNLIPFMEKHLGKNKSNLVMVSPDAGGTERARAYAKRLGATLAVIDKRRSKPNESEVMHIIGDIKDKRCVLVDDMIDTAGTLTSGARALVDSGAKSVIAVATHAILSGPAIQRLHESPIQEIIVTDTVPLSDEAMAMGKITVVSIADLLGKAIRSVHEADSVSRLFL